MKFNNLTPTNGFDFNDLNNARQNNYAWSMSELDDYIYVGTGRNILVNIILGIESQTSLPDLIKPNVIDNNAEIWRYRKNGKLPWERVFKAAEDLNIVGFRFMIQHTPFGGSPCLYAAALGESVQVLKSTNGVNWFVLPDNLEGTSSRAMITHCGKLYISTIDETNLSTVPLLYSSKDPEFYPWELVINPNAPGYDTEKNPTGAITNMAVFNNKIYVATSNDSGVQVWRTNKAEPEINDWTLVVANGFGNPANKYSLSIGVFKNHLYVSGTKRLPLSWFIPMGCDIVRIDKDDNWAVIVGGNQFVSALTEEPDGYAMRARVGAGFNNPFNVYAWQIQEYNGRLFISTFDDSSNMEVILTTLLANKDALYNIIGEFITNLLIGIYEAVVEILREIRYPIGFDLYVSEDGVHFESIFKNGLDNPNNYGGRILFVDSQNDFYIGTSNPFEGCEVWKAIDNACCWNEQQRSENDYRRLWEARNILNEKYDVIAENMPVIQRFVSNKYYHNFNS